MLVSVSIKVWAVGYGRQSKYFVSATNLLLLEIYERSLKNLHGAWPFPGHFTYYAPVSGFPHFDMNPPHPAVTPSATREDALGRASGFF